MHFRDVLEIAYFLIVSQLRRIVSTELVGLPHSIGVPVGVKVNERCKRSTVEPTCLNCGMRHLENRTSGNHDVAIRHCLVWTAYNNHVQPKALLNLIRIVTGRTCVDIVRHYPLKLEEFVQGKNIAATLHPTTKHPNSSRVTTGQVLGGQSSCSASPHSGYPNTIHHRNWQPSFYIV